MNKKMEVISKKAVILLDIAIRARNNAQAPYSNFLVGAAVMSKEGLISSGCNVERASYSQTSHAEQTAIDGLIAKYGSKKIEMIAIAAGPKGLKPSGPCWPCGHCRQIIWENCDGDMNVPIVTLVNNSTFIISTIGELLPHPFGPKDLGIKIFDKRRKWYEK